MSLIYVFISKIKKIILFKKMYQILLTFLFLFLLGNGGYIDNNRINSIICLRENSHPMYDIIGFKKKMIDGKYPCDHTYDTLTYDVSFYLH